MEKLSEAIIRLRNEEKTYNEIADELGCSKSTISYHLGEGQKEKNKERQEKRRKKIPFAQKIEGFKARKGIRNKAHHFQIRNNSEDKLSKFSKMSESNLEFTYHDVLAKIGKNPTCYISGDSIDLSEPSTYHFDHIIPSSKGGDNSLENLGIATKQANSMKHDLTLEEFLNKCEQILKYHGRI